MDETFKAIVAEAKADGSWDKKYPDEDDDIQDYKRQWVGLTDEEINKTYWRREPFRRPTQFEFARDIEQLLREKNNA